MESSLSKGPEKFRRRRRVWSPPRETILQHNHIITSTGDHFIREERSFSAFQQSFTLPEEVSTDKISAKCEVFAFIKELG